MPAARRALATSKAILACKVLPPLLRANCSSKNGVTALPRMPAASAAATAPEMRDSTSARGSAFSADWRIDDEHACGCALSEPAEIPVDAHQAGGVVRGVDAMLDGQVAFARVEGGEFVG